MPIYLVTGMPDPESALLEELPRSGIEPALLLEFTPSFFAVCSSKTPVAGKLLAF